MFPERHDSLLYAEQAIQTYKLHSTSITFLGHHDNLTFRVETRDGRIFLLRIHYPANQAFVDIRQTIPALRSEIQWLQALHEQAILHVQQPCVTIHNDHVSSITIGARDVPCTLLTWIDGTPWNAQDSDATAKATQIGRLLALLHHHTMMWQIPQNFVRPHYEDTFVQTVTQRLKEGVIRSVILPADYHIIEQSLTQSSEELQAISKEQRAWGLIHNDLHPGNYVFHKQGVSPLDFSLCGFGYYYFDLATSLGSIDIPFRQALLAGYTQQQSVTSIDIRKIEAGFIISRMSSYAFTLGNSTQHKWLTQRIPQVAEQICKRFLRNETFLFSYR